MSSKTMHADRIQASNMNSRELWKGLDRSPYVVEAKVEPEVKEKTCDEIINVNPIDEFERLMNLELTKGNDKYGKGDTTEFLRGIDPNLELGAIVKYASRIARGDSRAETDIVKIATYAYFYWKHHYSS